MAQKTTVRTNWDKWEERICIGIASGLWFYILTLTLR